ncbi:MAG TPA: RNA 2',3'-cyclic phosphodiesterase [Pyrinomonadaceae bacterium]|nr:RNA 2',3'-cyclic phosphodiesterase [Pyrinomonadaceae bacterium]
MGSKMADKRIFIAIDISEAARSECSRHIEELRGQFKDVRVGWERPEKLHITLKFLGATPDSVLTHLEAILPTIAARYRPFPLVLSGPGVFPSKARPRIFWIGVKDESEVTSELYKAVDQECSAFGFASERREFRPHVTVARVRERQKAGLPAEAHLRSKVEPVEFLVGEIILYESRLAPSGSVYSPVFRFRLGPNTLQAPLGAECL